MAISRLLKIGEAAAMLGVARGTLYHWHAQGKGPPVTKIGGSVRYSVDKLNSWLEAQTTYPDENPPANGSELISPNPGPPRKVSWKPRFTGNLTSAQRRRRSPRPSESKIGSSASCLPQWSSEHNGSKSKRGKDNFAVKCFKGRLA